MNQAELDMPSARAAPEDAPPSVAPGPLAAPDEEADGAAARGPSLMADIDALIGDGKTYLEAELTYQKSRAGFAAGRLKSSAIYGAAAFAFLHLALIALTVGAVIALTPLTGPWIATGIVVAVLLLGALVFLLRLRARVGEIAAAFRDETP